MNSEAKALAEEQRAAFKHLVFMARTSGGVAGRDEALCMACDRAEAALSQDAKPEANVRAEAVERAEADEDARLCGLGVLVAGKRVDPTTVQILSALPSGEVTISDEMVTAGFLASAKWGCRAPFETVRAIIEAALGAAKPDQEG